MNLGSTEEVTMAELAELIRSLTGARSPIVYTERPVDDPENRRPDTSLARDRLGWEPRIPLREGLSKTMIGWIRRDGAPEPSGETLPSPA